MQCLGADHRGTVVNGLGGAMAIVAESRADLPREDTARHRGDAVGAVVPMCDQDGSLRRAGRHAKNALHRLGVGELCAAAELQSADVCLVGEVETKDVYPGIVGKEGLDNGHAFLPGHSTFGFQPITLHPFVNCFLSKLLHALSRRSGGHGSR